MTTENDSKPAEGQSASNAGLGDWSCVDTDGLPDFRIFGFHTGRMVQVRRANGTESVEKYHGYGMFGKEMFEDVTHWRPNAELTGSAQLKTLPKE